MKASYEGHEEVVKILIEANAKVNTQKEVRVLFLPQRDLMLHIILYHTMLNSINEAVKFILIL